MRAQQGKELIDLRFKLGWSRQDFLDALRLVGDSIPVYAQFWSRLNVSQLCSTESNNIF